MVSELMSVKGCKRTEAAIHSHILSRQDVVILCAHLVWNLQTTLHHNRSIDMPSLRFCQINSHNSHAALHETGMLPSFVCSFVCLLACWFVRSFIHSFLCLSICLPVYLVTGNSVFQIRISIFFQWEVMLQTQAQHGSLRQS